MEFQASIPRGSLHASIQMEVDPSIRKGLDPWSSTTNSVLLAVVSCKDMPRDNALCKLYLKV